MVKQHRRDLRSSTKTLMSLGATDLDLDTGVIILNFNYGIRGNIRGDWEPVNYRFLWIWSLSIFQMESRPIFISTWNQNTYSTNWLMKTWSTDLRVRARLYSTNEEDRTEFRSKRFLFVLFCLDVCQRGWCRGCGGRRRIDPNHCQQRADSRFADA